MIRISRFAAVLLAVVMVLDLVAVVGTLGVLDLDPLGAFAAGKVHVKVAIIVGPVGGYTDYYRSEANKAAAVARQLTDDVETLYSPDASWRAARRVMEGASIVVYLGHGNGWPSPYRDGLYRPTQNGLGLNPVAGVDDSTHQYFGESFLARYVRLAPGAVVVLSHLCYASGNPEPGGPEPTVSVARQRADNYAAGWFAAGASAVIAEARSGPAYYVKALLRGRGSVERMWRDAPTFHDHVLAFESSRSQGATVLLDPDGARRGYNRSLALAGAVQIADLLRGAPAAAARPAAGSGSGDSADPPSLAGLGARFGTPELTGTPVAGGSATLTLPVDTHTRRLLPADLKIGTRWDTVDAVDVPASTAPTGASPSPTGASPPPTGASPPPTGAPGPAAQESAAPIVQGPVEGPGGSSASVDRPTLPSELGNPLGDQLAPTPEPAPTAAGPVATVGPDPGVPSLVSGDPPEVDLVEPEVQSKIVTTGPSVAGPKGSTVAVAVPAKPGLYRLVTTLHDGDGVAYDADTQDLIPALIVHVTGSLWATYGTPDTIALEVGHPAVVRLRVANSGTVSWGARRKEDLVEQDVGSGGSAPILVARWVALDDAPLSTERAVTAGVGRAFVEPGRTTVIEMIVDPPTMPGRYLLLFDVRTADGLSLASIGVPPGITRATVLAVGGTVLPRSPSPAPAVAPAGGSPTPTSAASPAPAP